MIKLLRSFISVVSQTTHIAFRCASWLTVLLVLLVTQQVIGRYFFNTSWVALQELQWHLFGFIITLSIAHALDVNGHVRVDILSNRFGSSMRRAVHGMGFFLLIPLCIALAYFGWQDVIQARSFTSSVPADFYTSLAFSEDSFFHPLMATLETGLRTTILVGEGSSDAGGLEARWMIKAAFPIGMLLLTLQSFCLLLRCLIPALGTDKEHQWL